MSHRIILLLFIQFTFSLSIFAQNPTVDPNFKPALSRTAGSDSFVSVIQPDGKIIVAPNFQVVNGQIIYNVARLNVDGSTDATFNCEICDFTITDIRLQPNGKILIGGKPTGGLSDKIYRLNSDGSQDNSFNYPGLSNGQNTSSIDIEGVQADGKILIIFRTNNGAAFLYRLNADGSIDTSFTPFLARTIDGQMINAKIFPDGRIFIYGHTDFGKIAQLNSDGSKNAVFESPNVFGTVWDIAIQPEGKIVFVGNFTSVNGINRKNYARLNADQTLDLNFNPAFTFDEGSFPYRTQIIALSTGKLLIGDSRFGNEYRRLVRLNNDGTSDNTFGNLPYIDFISMSVDSSERIYAFLKLDGDIKLVRINADGSLDASFNPSVEIGGSVNGLGQQPDGKILVGGNYVKANNITGRVVSRINLDGTTDTTFNTNGKFGSGTIVNFGFQPDGKILVAGVFFYNNVLKSIVRLNSDGSEDTSFNVNIVHSFSPRINAVVIEPDGKILIGGVFTSVNGVSKKGLARLNSDGSVDNSFDVQLGGNGTIGTILKQSDGKYMIAGTFAGINGSNRTNLARLNADGTLDTSFNASVAFVSKIALTTDGKYVVTGSTAVGNGQSIIYKLNADGSPVAGFQSPTFGSNTNYINGVQVLSDNSIVITGNLVSVNGTPRNGIARLNSDGSLNAASFTIGTDVNFPPLALIKQSDGNLLVGGEFKYIENKRRTGLARIIVTAPIAKTPFDFDGDGRTDIVAYRPSNSVWYQLLGQSYQFSSVVFGSSEDILAPADYDGDGKTDLGIYRPSTSVFWYRSTAQNNAFRAVQWGQTGDVPLPSDVDGDGKDDFVVYRPSNSAWYRLTSTGQATSFGFGIAGDKPLIGDFDGDGKSDYAVYRPSTGVWWFTYSSQNNATRAVQFGASEDIPVAADYDGDGKTDFAVFRPSNGGWYILNSGNSSVTSVGFGLSGDKPIAGDYDGDGKADIAVYRPSNGGWYLLRSTAGFAGIQLGVSTDIPLPNAFIKQ